MFRQKNRPPRIVALPARGQWQPLEKLAWDDEDTRVKTATLPATMHTPGGSRGGYPTAEEVERAMRETRRLPSRPAVAAAPMPVAQPMHPIHVAPSDVDDERIEARRKKVRSIALAVTFVVPSMVAIAYAWMNAPTW